MDLRLAADVTCDSIVDGPGLRMVIWAQGCKHNCYKCHNPQTHKLDGGFLSDTEYLIQKMKNLKLHRGITLSGGEPFLQPKPLSIVSKTAKELGLDVWCYTGFLFEELIDKNNINYKDNMKLLENIDILVDGKFISDKRKISLKFRGSSNQRIINIKKSIKYNKIILENQYMK